MGEVKLYYTVKISFFKRNFVSFAMPVLAEILEKIRIFLFFYSPSPKLPAEGEARQGRQRGERAVGMFFYAFQASEK